MTWRVGGSCAGHLQRLDPVLQGGLQDLRLVEHRRHLPRDPPGHAARLHRRSGPASTPPPPSAPTFVRLMDAIVVYGCAADARYPVPSAEEREGVGAEEGTAAGGHGRSVIHHRRCCGHSPELGFVWPWSNQTDDPVSFVCPARLSFTELELGLVQTSASTPPRPPRTTSHRGPSPVAGGGKSSARSKTCAR